MGHVNLSISVSHNKSSNVNEVIKAILDVFIQKLHVHKKAQTAYRRAKIKNVLKNTSKGKKSLIRLFASLCFCLGVFVPFVLLLGCVLCFV